MTTRAFFIVLLILLVFPLHGQSILEIPVPKQFVNDFAGILSEGQEAALEAKLKKHEVLSSNQIAIVTVKSLEGNDPAYLAHSLADKWGVGQKEKDNGILILLKPKYSGSKGRVYIAVGYGLEHVVSDAMAKRIVNQQLIPSFKKNKYYEGLDKALETLMELSVGEYSNNFRQIPILKREVLVFAGIGLSILLLPIIYLVFLRYRKVPERFSHFYFEGEYTVDNVISHVDQIEQVYQRNYPKFKRQIRKYNFISKKYLMKYSDKIDRRLFCCHLKGEKRFKAFFKWADPMLYFILAYLLGIQLLFTAMILFNVGVLEFIVANVVLSFLFYALLNFLVSLLEIFLFSLRSKAKFTGGVILALFALYTIFKKNIRRKFVLGSYVYYPHVTYVSASYGGGGYGGFGGGGFGGGGFGGGGAGGSW